MAFASSSAFLVSTAILAAVGYAQSAQSSSAFQTQRCKTPATAPERIEKVITTCQDEIKLAILQEALDVLSDTTKEVAQATVSHRSKRETFTKEERRIAGCLLQCVYRKVKAIDETGFPTVAGLVQLYADGVTERGYYIAIAQSVQQCLDRAHQQRLAANQTDKGAQSCDVAYNVFDCVSDQMASYCAGK